MWVVLNQTKNGVADSALSLMNTAAASRNSSSTVSMRILVSGPVHRRQVLVPVAQMVLAELARGVAMRLERRGNRRVLRQETEFGPGQAHLRQTGTGRVLPADECRSSRRAGLFPVVVGEPDALVGDPVDVGSAVAHETVAVAAEIGDPDVITPDHQDVRVPMWHAISSGGRMANPNLRRRRVLIPLGLPQIPALGALSTDGRLPLANCHRPAHPGVGKSLLPQQVELHPLDVDRCPWR